MPIWSKVAVSIGGTYVDRGVRNQDELRYRDSKWELLIDTYINVLKRLV